MTGNREVRMHARGTSVTVGYPWGVYVSARVLCPDGVVRTVKRIATTADTWFSVPCAVTVRGKTVAGYMTLTDAGSDEEPHVAFRPYLYRKNHTVFATDSTASATEV